MLNHIELLKNLGLSTKAAKIYLAALELGEATVQQLAHKSKIKRTSLYYLLDELISAGALMRAEGGKKTLYIAQRPASLLRLAKERVVSFEAALGELEERAAAFDKPHVYFLFGSNGFRQAWDQIFATKEKEYRIITQGESFLSYVSERYIVDQIITKKKRLGITSRQLITDSIYARKMIAKDRMENRVSKLLPPTYKLPFTEIISGSMVVLISPKFNNMAMIIKNGDFSKTRRSIFDALWDSLI
jgi:sugar-specific transcriptional regulator TrmB